jgi:hypothetical protein
VIASILVIGVIVGLAAVRDSVVTELADVAQALANLNQSYSYSGVTGHHAFSGGGAFNDAADFCDNQWSNGDWGNSKCVRICSGGGPVAKATTAAATTVLRATKSLGYSDVVRRDAEKRFIPWPLLGAEPAVKEC